MIGGPLLGKVFVKVLNLQRLLIREAPLAGRSVRGAADSVALWASGSRCNAIDGVTVESKGRFRECGGRLTINTRC